MSNPPGSNSFDNSMDLFDDGDQSNMNTVDEDDKLQIENNPNEQANTDTNGVNFQCPFCNEFKLDEFSLHIHIQSFHPEDNIQSTFDGENMNIQPAENGTGGFLETGTFLCPYCSGSHKTKKDLAEHLILTHEKEVEVKDLEEMLRSLDFLLCPLCRYICSSAEEIQRHIDDQHSSTEESQRDYPGNAASASSLVTVCPVCGLNEPDSDLLASHIELHFDSPSNSANHLNPSLPSTSKKAQSVCVSSSSSSTSSKSSSSMSSENKSSHRGRRKRNGYHYKQQYRQGLEKAVVKGKMSPGDYYEHMAQMQEKDMNGTDDGHSKTEGLIEQLESFYRNRSREGQSAVLCGALDYYCGSYGDRGWGCGYRNFQMMLSCLSRIDLYSHRLFQDGRIRIPSVPKIQEMIETAWQRGFDREGCLQLEGKVVHTRKWIGATEIVATLSSLGIKCELVDFPWPSSPDGTHPRLLQWVKDYFYRDHNAKPPLYLQHQGHSRTIVGVEVDKGTTRLLLFDPGSSKEHMASIRSGQLTWKQMGTFRRNLAAFKAKQYQIVSVVGLLGKEESERSKRLTSTRIM